MTPARYSPALTGGLFLAALILAAWGNQLMASRRATSAKKRLIPAFLLGVAVLFLGTLAFLGVPIWLLAAAAIIVFAVGAIQKERARFCPGCGLSSFNDARLAGAEFCPRCGAKLER
jgi:ribosomal protein S27AE